MHGINAGLIPSAPVATLTASTLDTMSDHNHLEPADALSRQETADSAPEHSEPENVRWLPLSSPSTSSHTTSADGLNPIEQAANSLLLQDTFEDANDTTHNTTLEPARDRSTERTRSLTNRSSTSVKSPTIPESVSDSRPVSGITDAAGSAVSETEPETETDGDGAASEHNEDLDDAKPANSPLLTTHRLSTTSLHNVNLEEDAAVPAVAAPKGIFHIFSPMP